jgi:hypothetical protein
MPAPAFTLDEIHADLATVDALLAELPEEDVLGRRSLRARREILVQELATQPVQTQPSAHAAVYAGGAVAERTRGA